MQKRKKNYKMKPVTRYSLYGLSALVVLLAVIAYMYVSKGSMDNPVELPKSARSKVDATKAFLSGTPYNRVIRASINNGSDWVVTSTDIEVARERKYDEHINNHQNDIVCKFNEEGLIYSASNLNQILSYCSKIIENSALSRVQTKSFGVSIVPCLMKKVESYLRR